MSHPALTQLSEEERLFRDSVLDFARKRVQPRVAAMDEAGLMDLDILPGLFELGLMGIEIPEEYGGAGRHVLPRHPRGRRALARVDPSVGVIVDVQNTLSQQRAAALGERRRRRSATCRAWRTIRWRSYALSEAGSGSDAFALATRGGE